MRNLTPNRIFTFLIAAWTAIFVGFWSMIYLGGNAIVWVVENIFGYAGEGADTLISIAQNVGTVGLFMIWFMGAAGLFILRKWLSAITKGPGEPYDVEIVHDGKTIETSYQDVTEKR